MSSFCVLRDLSKFYLRRHKNIHTRTSIYVARAQREVSAGGIVIWYSAVEETKKGMMKSTKKS